MSRTIKLEPFEEIVGVLERIEREDDEITIIINGLKLVFPAGSVEAESVDRIKSSLIKLLETVDDFLKRKVTFSHLRAVRMAIKGK